MKQIKTSRYPWLWDVELDNPAFDAVLRGEKTLFNLNADWAMLRVIEYAPYRDIKRLLPVDDFLRRWPVLMPKVRSVTRREGMAFFASWIQRTRKKHD